jgi:hypothetical protein
MAAWLDGCMDFKLHDPKTNVEKMAWCNLWQGMHHKKNCCMEKAAGAALNTHAAYPLEESGEDGIVEADGVDCGVQPLLRSCRGRAWAGARAHHASITGKLGARLVGAHLQCGKAVVCCKKQLPSSYTKSPFQKAWL